MNSKINEINNKLSQNLSELQINPSIDQNESESLEVKPQTYSGKADLIVVRDQNILLGLINYGENNYFFNCVIQVLHSLPIFRDYIKQFRSPFKGVAIKIRSL